MKKLFHNLVLAILAFGFCAYTVFGLAENGGLDSIIGSKSLIYSGGDLEIKRGEETVLVLDGQSILQGDQIKVGETDVMLSFANDGEIRAKAGSEMKVTYYDSEQMKLVLSVSKGEFWVNTSYSNLELNVVFNGAVLVSGQSVSYLKVDENKAQVSTIKHFQRVNLVGDQYSDLKMLTEQESSILNSLTLPEKTQLTVYGLKVKENQAVIPKLLFSKLIKEFQYSALDLDQLLADEWIALNLEKDRKKALKVKNDRQKLIRDRGIILNIGDGWNAVIEENWRSIENGLTFSEKKRVLRKLDISLENLNDAQYLFDVGKNSEAKERLSLFEKNIEEILLQADQDLKTKMLTDIKRRYDYLSFLNPEDAVYELRMALGQIYRKNLLAEDVWRVKIEFLQEKLDEINFYAENNNNVRLKLAFEAYKTLFKELETNESKDVNGKIYDIQKLNQLLHNLFLLYSQLSREDYFLAKVGMENYYLSLMPAGESKVEEVQTVISQRIDLMKKMQQFYFLGQVPLTDAVNILELTIQKINDLAIADAAQAGIIQVYEQRLAELSLFYQFLQNGAYRNSVQKGSDLQQRFEQFKREQQNNALSFEETAKKIIEENVMAETVDNTANTETSSNNTSTDSVVKPDENIVKEPVTSIEDQVTVNVNGEKTEINLNPGVDANNGQVTTNPENTNSEVVPPVKKIPRVKPR